MTVALIYLARGKDGGLTTSELFFESYMRFPPEYPHELVVIVKGWDNQVEEDNLVKLARESGAAQIMKVPDDGYDWGAYMRVAPELTQDWLCFLNTHTRLMVTGWLSFLMHATHPSVGAVSATGSWESLAPIMPRYDFRLPIFSFLAYPLRMLVNFLRFIRNAYDYPLFPNPHLRTNAFLVKSSIFLEFISEKNIPKCKRDANILESGRRGFSNYLLRKKLNIYIVGRDGTKYAPHQWSKSGIFRSKNQENLLVSDNQTRSFLIACEKMKKFLEYLAWG
jgi:hypothetical protein